MVEAAKVDPLNQILEELFGRELACSTRRENSSRRLQQDAKIQGKTPIANVIEVLNFLHTQVAIAAGRDLPKSCQARHKTGAQVLKIGTKPLQVICRERSRAYETDVPSDHIPELR